MATLRVYYNNAYNKTDIPATKDVLEANSSYYDYEISDLNSEDELTRTFRIQLLQNSNANLCYIDGRFYFIESVRKLNNNVYELSTTFNPITTSMTHTQDRFKIVGRATRRTPTGDQNLGNGNMLTEPFSPSGRRKVSVKSGDLGFPTITTNSRTFHLSIINLWSGGTIESGKETYHYRGTTESPENGIDYIQTTPARFVVSPPDFTTSVRMHLKAAAAGSSTALRAWSLDNAAVFDAANSVVKNTIRNANEWGLAPSSYLLATWTIPAVYASTTSEDNKPGKIQVLEGYSASALQAETTAASGLNNKKAGTYGQTVIATSLISGDSRTYRWADVVSGTTDGGTEYANFYVIVNPLPNGRPYLVPSRFKKANDSSSDPITTWPLNGAVAGGEWYKPLLTVSGKTGITLAGYQTQDQINAIINGQNAAVSNDLASGLTSLIPSANLGDQAATITPTAAGSGRVISDFGSMVSNWISGLGAYNSSDYAARQAAGAAYANYKIASTTYSPTYIPPQMPDFGALIPNNFQVVVENYSNEDQKRFDKFLTAYGWATNEVVDQQLASANLRGTYFEYLQMSDCSVSYSTSSTHMAPGCLNLVKAFLQSGVRIWHNGSPATVSYDTQNIA